MLKRDNFSIQTCTSWYWYYIIYNSDGSSTAFEEKSWYASS